MVLCAALFQVAPSKLCDVFQENVCQLPLPSNLLCFAQQFITAQNFHLCCLSAFRWEAMNPILNYELCKMLVLIQLSFWTLNGVRDAVKQWLSAVACHPEKVVICFPEESTQTACRCDGGVEIHNADVQCCAMSVQTGGSGLGSQLLSEWSGSMTMLLEAAAHGSMVGR